MKRLSLVGLLPVSIALFAANSAFAQEVPPASAAPAAPKAGCVLGDHSGVSPSDAETGRKIVCEEVARAGGSPTTLYKVDLELLGKALFVTVSEDGGTESRRLRLAEIEELPIA